MGKHILLAGFSLLCSMTLLSRAAVCQTIAIPFHLEDNLLIVNVLVDGRTATVILDTGSQSTFLTPEAIGMSNVIGLSNLQSNARMATGVSRNTAISLTQNSSIFNQPVTVVRLDELNHRMGRKFNGILGQDFLRQFKVFTIDYRSKTVVFSR